MGEGGHFAVVRLHGEMPLRMWCVDDSLVRTMTYHRSQMFLTLSTWLLLARPIKHKFSFLSEKDQPFCIEERAVIVSKPRRDDGRSSR
jgi:hypothetical protein